MTTDAAAADVGVTSPPTPTLLPTTVISFPPTTIPGVINDSAGFVPFAESTAAAEPTTLTTEEGTTMVVPEEKLLLALVLLLAALNEADEKEEMEE
jgi:hypothetical protein